MHCAVDDQQRYHFDRRKKIRKRKQLNKSLDLL